MSVDSDKAITKAKMWLIDDDPALRLVLEDNFTDAGLEVVSFSQAHGAWIKLNDVLQGNAKKDVLPDVILTDIRMPMMDGLSFSEWVNKNLPELPIVIMTAHSDLQSAVDSYQTGAFEYLPKPFDLDEAINVVNKAISINCSQKSIKDTDQSTKNNKEQTKTPEEDSLSQPNQNKDMVEKGMVSQVKDANFQQKNSQITSKKINKPNKKTASGQNPHGIIGQSAAMQTVFRAIGRLAHSPITVLITGESGTGKEMVAHALHETSPRKDKPLIALNMAAIPHDLIESELFGHEKGAFTGATKARQGRFEQANGGTLFLDEIGDMPYSTQTRLLRVLANGEFFRVGGQQPVKVDVRIIAATHQNLEALVKKGKFREDLFYRLNVIRLPLPSLRQRKEDIPALVEHFLEKTAAELATEPKHIDSSAMQVIQQYDWLGNVRELENSCRWLTVMASGNTVFIEDLPPELLTVHATSHQQDNDEQIGLQNTANNVLHQQSNNFDTTVNTGAQSTTVPHNIEQNTQSNVISSLQGRRYPFTEPDISASDMDKSWMGLLSKWAIEALHNGETELLKAALPNFEKIMIEVTLTYTKGHKGKASELLGWGRNTLTRKIQQLGLDDRW